MTNLSLTRGDKATVQVTLSNLPSSGLTGFKFWFTAKKLIGDADGSAVFQKTTANFTVVTNGSSTVSGVITCPINPSDTSALPDYAVPLLYDVQVEDASSNPTTVCSGLLIVAPDVTRSS